MQGLYKDTKKHYAKDKLKQIWKKHSFDTKSETYDVREIFKYERHNQLEYKTGWELNVARAQAYRKQNLHNWIMETDEVKLTRMQKVSKFKYKECLKCQMLSYCNMASLLVYTRDGKRIEFDRKYHKELESNMVWCKAKDVWDSPTATYKIVGERKQKPTMRSVIKAEDVSKVYWEGMEITNHMVYKMFDLKEDKYKDWKSARRKIKEALKLGADTDKIKELSVNYVGGYGYEYRKGRRHSMKRGF